MSSVGEILRRARQEQGLDMDTVAARTKISAKFLEAIEADDRKRLPSGFFYKSFVEQYARFLSLDTREIAAEIDRVLSADEPLPLPGFESVVARNVPPMTSTHRFHTRRSSMSAVSLALVLVGCSGVYVLWHSARSYPSLSGMIAGVRALAKPKTNLPRPAVKTAPQPVPVPPAAVPTALVPPAAVPPAVVPPAVVPPATVPPATVPVALASETKPKEEDGRAASDPAPNSDYKVMLDLMAHEATWLSVSSDGKPVFSGTLRANETKTVGGKQFAKLRVGNAAGIEVRLNGRLLGPLGSRGQVLTVLFTPDNFQIFSAPKESD